MARAACPFFEIAPTSSPTNPGPWAVSASRSRALLGRAKPPAKASHCEYNRDVRPILAENCFPCHGPDSAARKADLRLDKREAAVQAGAIAPGDIEASELIARINAADPKEVMPPAATTKTLSSEAKRCPQAVDCRRRSLPIALVSHSAGARRTAKGQGSVVVP